MYDDFSDTYDRFVNWSNRLAFEMPFIEAQLESLSPLPGGGLQILDAACGTGWHAITLSQRGHFVTGADLSARMIERARINAQDQGAQVTFLQAGFDRLAQDTGAGKYDAVLCLGNSLPHVQDSAALRDALENFRDCLHPGGLLLLQNRNFDAVMANQQRWMEPQSQMDGDKEWLFIRFYDFEPDGTISFNILNLYREKTNPWQQRIHSTLLFPLLHHDLVENLHQVGFTVITAFGGLDGSAFDSHDSGNLVLCAFRSS